METQLVSLLQDLQRPNNAERHAAEEQFSAVVAHDPSTAAATLLQVAASSNNNIADRQSALLCLKRMVPVHWSAGFESFTGPAISTEAKERIRPELLRLATEDANSKVRSGAAYSVTQVAAVDYPDEWPDLLDYLYATIINGGSGVLGALALLQELFDDLVTEEQFFGGVGVVTIGHCMKLMSDSSIPAQVRTASAKLYKSCLLQLQSPEILDDDEKFQGLKHHVTEMAALLTVLLGNKSMDIYQIQFRTALYTIAYQLITELPEELFEHNAKLALQKEATEDLAQISDVYVQAVVKEEDSLYSSVVDSEISVGTSLKNIIIEQLQLLGSFNDIPLTKSTSVSHESILQSVIKCSLLPLETESDFAADYNLLVTEETGFSPEFGARNAVFDFITELTPQDVSVFFEYFVSRLAEACSTRTWKEQEAALFCLDSLFRHDATLKSSQSPVSLLNSLTTLLDDPEPFVRSRVILALPAFFSKFKSSLGGEFGIKTFLECARHAHNDSDILVKAMFLVSLTYFNSIIKLEDIPDETQHVVISMISTILETAQEDTPPLLAEALTATLKIHTGTNIEALSLLFQIASKDPGNVQLALDVEEALEELLLEVDMQSYMAYSDAVLLGLLSNIESSRAEFSSELSLSLQVLTIFINSVPEAYPPELFNRVNPVLSNLLLQATDDQILQQGGETFHALITHSEPEMFDVNTVLQVLSKFLSPELSDSAAMNAGSLVVAVLSKFSSNISDILPQILEATTRRLLSAKELSTTEDLLSVLCLMISTDVEQTIAFLQQYDIQKVFNVWLSNFPALTGVERITKNCEGLTQVFMYASQHQNYFQFTVDGDEVVEVPGDIIITRSMRKNMTKKYTQVSIPYKIIKLLVAELKDQSAQPGAPEPEDLIDSVGDDNNDEGWEDVDAIGDDFDTLRGYVENDEGGRGQDEGLKEILVGFFKQVASSNIDGFREIYNGLSDEEKQVLAENIV